MEEVTGRCTVPRYLVCTGKGVCQRGKKGTARNKIPPLDFISSSLQVTCILSGNFLVGKELHSIVMHCLKLGRQWWPGRPTTHEALRRSPICQYDDLTQD